MAKKISEQHNHHWGWVVLTLLALIILAWLVNQFVLQNKGRTTREFREQQEIINEFNDVVTPLNSVQRKEIDDTFFGN